MEYEGTVIRPPSEAHSILLQATLGCSHNKCAFCGAYKDKRFRVRDPEALSRDLDFAVTHCKRQRRVFLCDGDALILPQKKLIALLDEIRTKLPWVTRVSTYGNAKALVRKSLEELGELREAGLRVVYMGLESGDDVTLAAMNKASTVETMIREGRKCRKAGLKLNVTVLLGLAGPERSREHAEATGKALTAMDPEYAAALTLMLIPGTPLFGRHEAGEFTLLDSTAMLAELRAMLAATHMSRGQFFANHASNYLPLVVRMPSGKEAALERIDQALAGEVELTPEGLRRL
ncbi:MAG: radical SAM protein [Desulfovibrio sp.]|nr:MAG: radical SAM protein [Desulfovibrio sp.]